MLIPENLFVGGPDNNTSTEPLTLEQFDKAVEILRNEPEEVYLTIEEQVDLWDAVHKYAKLSYSGEELPVTHPNIVARELAVIDLQHTVISIIENRLRKE